MPGFTCYLQILAKPEAVFLCPSGPEPLSWPEHSVPVPAQRHCWFSFSSPFFGVRWNVASVVTEGVSIYCGESCILIVSYMAA